MVYIIKVNANEKNNKPIPNTIRFLSDFLLLQYLLNVIMLNWKLNNITIDSIINNISP